MSLGYNRGNLRGEVIWEFEMLVNGQQVNVKISNDTGKIVNTILRQGLVFSMLEGVFLCLKLQERARK